jgi:hypothetical protein
VENSKTLVKRERGRIIRDEFKGKNHKGMIIREELKGKDHKERIIREGS